MNSILEVKHLSKVFYLSKKEKFKAVNDVSFCLYENEALGIVGESGCGKTTLARCLVSLYKIDEGEIIYHGEKKDIQMIFQDPISSINPRMTIYDVIKEGLVVNGEKDVDDKIFLALKKVGLSEDIINRFPGEFSGGQLQRIGIARALVMNPKILIADEIVSSLDVSIQSQIINLLNQLKKDNLSMIFIAHNLNIVKYFCSRIIVMYKGQIVEIASSEELFKNPLHPYTKKLIESIPIPDPNIEKSKKEDTEMFSFDIKEGSTLVEVEKDHFVRR